MYRSAWVRIRSASKSCANIKLRRPRERSRVRAPRRTNPSRSAPHVERTPPRSTCRGALDRFAWRTAAFTHRFARARSRGARSRGLRAPSRAQSWVPTKTTSPSARTSTWRSKVDATSTRSAPPLSPPRYRPTPLPPLPRRTRLLPLLTRTSLRVPSWRRTPPRSCSRWTTPRTPPAIGSWAAPPTSTHLRRGKPPSRAKYSATSTATGAATSTRDPARSPTPTSPFPSTPSPRLPTSTLGSTKLPAEAATRFDASPVQSSGTTTRRRFGIRANLLVFSRLTPTPGTRRVERPPRNAAKFPGSNDEFEYARCWNDTASIFVTIVDVCPCSYSWGKQRVCCGPIPHFDLSFWAAERLAHPVQGKQMLRFRPVDCATREPVNARLGAVARMRTRRPASRDGVLTSGGGNGQRVASFRGGVRGGDGRREIAVYENAPGVGWSWSAYKDVKTKLSSPGRGANGTSAACFEVSPGGRLAMHCIGCEATAKPFVSAREIRFWIRSPDCERDPTDEPPVYLGVATRSVRDYETGTTPGETACGWKTNVWTHVESKRTDSNCGRVARVPTTSFGCGGTAAARANALFFELGQSATRQRELCVDDVRILS